MSDHNGETSVKTPSGPVTPGGEKSKWDRSEVEEVLGSLEEIKEGQSDIKEAGEDKREKLEKIQRQNKELKKQLERYKRSVPLPVYGALISGILISTFGYYFANDLIYFVGGISIVSVSLTAILESKLRGGRMQ